MQHINAMKGTWILNIYSSNCRARFTLLFNFYIEKAMDRIREKVKIGLNLRRQGGHALICVYKVVITQ